MDKKSIMNFDHTAPYKKIVEAIGKKPIAYTTTGIPFWDDEYISRSMLALHLNPDVESASRTHEFMDRSVDWIVTKGESSKSKIQESRPGPHILLAKDAEGARGEIFKD